MPPLLTEVKPAAHRPQFRVCYLCGQQFGSASIGIHVPQCYQKKLSQWEVTDPAVRGPKPKHPDTVKWKGGNGASVEAINKEQYQEFNSQLVACPHCARTFLPDRLPVHLRGCKGDGKVGVPPSKMKADGGGGSTPGGGKPKSEPRRAAGRRSLSPGPPLLPTCYLCGQQFGTASIGIHVPQCYEKKLAQWQNADPRSRGHPPKHPDTVNWRGRPGASPREQAEEQFQEFMNNLEECPNCSRRFLPDRLVVHLRSCRPDNPPKPTSPRKAKAAGGARCPTSTTATTPAETAAPKASVGDQTPRSEKQQQKQDPPTSSAGEDWIHPKRNRLTRHSTLPAESRVCPQCDAVEYDADAKFCRDCGHSFVSKQLSSPCQHCGERIPHGSRFCGTCGQPVKGASAHERTPGGPNKHASTVRSVVCPACEAISDADGNFCDNCGAALGDADLTPAPAAAGAAATPPSFRAGGSTEHKAVLYCAKCNETVEDTTAVFCEDCGGRLEALKVPTTKDGGPPRRADGTLPPSHVARLKAAMTSRPQQPSASEPAKTTTAPVASSAAPARPATRSACPPTEEHTDDESRAYAEDDLERVPCSHCGRRFASESLAKHERICGSQKKRRVFNATKQRLPEGAIAAAKPSAGSQPTAPKRDWKAESESFRRALREARQVDQVLKAGGTAKDLPPPTYSTNPDYVPCPHCQRRFAPDVAARHIPRCANTVNRPKPPPRRR
ncbi:conserved hypothetical protein [Leishmania infantum JPCM5]|uniref:C2HC/C3H-type domain-containing protein n=2 Tax=Leishmania infantum TaxID=5671 RepID=A4HXN3_LEIIN|nr:conserved hypothetical protein [Leishmania infantum JPCM5]CAC9479469.1 zinc-finger_of_a_C2HC-type/Double_zinc_ribbon_-_putative [Leishmania infantum]CAM67060.1 conserved hypothetical protein [Leishmania infantum JPCM5]SUZ40931.1 zinc-finger_of_a_C2HC-type/Double_zinc_ribbon_-_putative [Leishmania infantum]|eukprot:XP_001464824.1 conserved hypothetical protein [Leishmania infantum JPCM5]